MLFLIKIELGFFDKNLSNEFLLINYDFNWTIENIEYIF